MLLRSGQDPPYHPASPHISLSANDSMASDESRSGRVMREMQCLPGELPASAREFFLLYQVGRAGLVASPGTTLHPLHPVGTAIPQRFHRRRSNG